MAHRGAISDMQDPLQSRYCISHDGSTLEVDASPFDTIDIVLSRYDFSDDVTGRRLLKLISKLSSLVNKPLSLQSSPITALSQIFVTEGEEDSSVNSQYAPEWLCYKLALAVLEEINLRRPRALLDWKRRLDASTAGRHDFQRKLKNGYMSEHASINVLMGAFDNLRAMYPNEPWPDWASPRSLDKELHIKHLREKAALNQETKPFSSHQSKQKKVNTVAAKSKQEESKPKRLEEDSRYTPRNPITHQRLSVSVFSTLEWRKIFITKRGLIGHGPEWLEGGETIMNVRSAGAPYAFIPRSVDQNQREQQLRRVLDKNDADYFKLVPKLGGKWGSLLWRPVEAVKKKVAEVDARELDKKKEILVRMLKRLEQEGREEGAWILRGEVYINGYMGEDVEVEEPWRRIKIL